MIGIDISDLSVKIVQLSERKPYRLLTHCWKPIPLGVMDKGVVKNPRELQKIVADALRSCSVGKGFSDSIVASIPETQSFLRVIEIPNMEEDEIGEAVQWEVAQHIPFGLENVYIDWQPLKAGHRAATGHQEVLVGAAQKKVVDPLYETLHSLELDVAALELESQALVRSIVSAEMQEKQGVLIVDFGGTATNVIIHDHGTMRFTASLQKGMEYVEKTLTPTDIQALHAGLQQTDKTEKDRIWAQIQPALQEVVAEVRGIVEFYNSIDAQHDVKEILLAGGGSNLPGLDKVFLKYFEDVHTQRGNPWVNILSGQKSAAAPMNVVESVRYATALGLALRAVSS